MSVICGRRGTLKSNLEIGLPLMRMPGDLDGGSGVALRRGLEQRHVPVFVLDPGI